MIRTVLFGLVWFVLLYLVACMLTGGLAGAIAGANDPDNAAAGAQAGAEMVASLRMWLALGSLLIVILAAWAGILPGAMNREGR